MDLEWFNQQHEQKEQRTGVTYDQSAVIEFAYRLNDCLFLTNGQPYTKVVKRFTVWAHTVKEADLIADKFGASRGLIAERDE